MLTDRFLIMEKENIQLTYYSINHGVTSDISVSLNWIYRIPKQHYYCSHEYVLFKHIMWLLEQNLWIIIIQFHLIESDIRCELKQL